MGHQGRCYQELPKNSPEFVKFSDMFEPRLERLYKIECLDEMEKQLGEGEWKEYFFHCTGDCSCLEAKVNADPQDLYVRTESGLWCKRPQCPIQGILKHGFLLKYSGLHRHNWRSCKKAHYVSPTVGIARWRGVNKCPARKFLAHFICKVRDDEVVDKDTHAVYSNAHIRPLFLAIVPV